MRWSWSERWCPQKTVPGGRSDGRRSDPRRGGLPGPGRVDLGLLTPGGPAHHPNGRSATPGSPTSSSRCTGTLAAPMALFACTRSYGWPWDCVGHNAVALLMRRAGLAGTTGRPKWRHAKPDQVAADLVDRKFSRSGPNQLWVTDITEHPTREGKVYCAVVLDAFSRQVVGWSIDAAPTAALVTNALGMAVQTRTPPAGAVIHSDQGVLVTDAGRAAGPPPLEDPGRAGQRDL